MVVTGVAFALVALGLTNAHALTLHPDSMTGADSVSPPTKPNSKHTKRARVDLTKKQAGRMRNVTNVPTTLESPIRTWEWRRLDLTPLGELTAGLRNSLH